MLIKHLLYKCYFLVSYNTLLLIAGWSNFCTLVGHFSKLFEFAGLSRLKIPIFVPKSGCSLKKKKALGIGLQNSYFRSKIRVFSKKKKKRSSLGIGLQNSYFRSKIRVFSKKKKKGLHLESVCKIPIFVPKSGFSLKKKKKGLHLESVCKIPIFVPKSGCSLKKKKKVFTWNRSAKFLFSFQNQGVL